jgi:hypothetical protein
VKVYDGYAARQRDSKGTWSYTTVSEVNTGATISDSQGVGTITNDDGAAIAGGRLDQRRGD